MLPPFGNSFPFSLRQHSDLFVAPPFLRRLPSNLLAPFGGHPFGSRLPAVASKRHGGGVLPLSLGGWDVLVNLADRQPHDVNGVADYVAGAALTFRASGHCHKVMLSDKLGKDTIGESVDDARISECRFRGSNILR